MTEIKRIMPRLNKEDIKHLILKYPELKDAIMSSYLNQFIKQGNIDNNIDDINEIYNINLRHQPRKYTVPHIEKIKISKPKKIIDYENLVPNTFQTTF